MLLKNGFTDMFNDTLDANDKKTLVANRYKNVAELSNHLFDKGR